MSDELPKIPNLTQEPEKHPLDAFMDHVKKNGKAPEDIKLNDAVYDPKGKYVPLTSDHIHAALDTHINANKNIQNLWEKGPLTLGNRGMGAISSGHYLNDFNQSHINKIFDKENIKHFDPGTHLQQLVRDHYDKLTPEHIENLSEHMFGPANAFREYNNLFTTSVLDGPKTTEKTIQHAIDGAKKYQQYNDNSAAGTVHMHGAKYTPKQINEAALISNSSSSWGDFIELHGHHLEPETVNKLATGPITSVHGHKGYESLKEKLPKLAQFKDEHVDHWAKHDATMESLLDSHPDKIEKKHILSYLDNAHSKGIDSNVFDKIANLNSFYSSRNEDHGHKIDGEVVDKLFDAAKTFDANKQDYTGYTDRHEAVRKLAQIKSLEDRHIDAILNNEIVPHESASSPGILGTLSKNPALKPHHIEKLWETGDEQVRASLLSQEHVPDNLKQKAFSGDGELMRHFYDSEAPRSDEDIEAGLSHSNPEVKLWAATHGGAKEHHIERALKELKGTDFEKDIIKHTKKNGMWEDPTQVEFSLGTGKLRQLRDMAEKNNGTIHKKDAEKAGLKPSELGIAHLQDAKGNIPYQKLHEHIENQPKLKFGYSHSTYGTDSAEEAQREYDDAYNEHMDSFDPNDHVNREDHFDEDRARDHWSEQFDPEKYDLKPNEDGEYDDADYSDAMDYHNEQFPIDDYMEDDRFFDQNAYDEEVERAANSHADSFYENYRGRHPDSFDHSERDEDAGNEQRHSSEQSKVFQVNITKDHVKKLKDAGVYDRFKNLLDQSRMSSHPVADNGIGWVRYTEENNGVHIDEIQSDFSQRFSKQIAQQAKAAKEKGEITEEQRQQIEADARKKYDDNEEEKIYNILFGEAGHPNDILHEAFLQHLRNDGKHLGNEVHIWDDKPKGELSGQQDYRELPVHMQHTYGQMPKKMGYKKSKYGTINTQISRDLKGKDTWAHKLVKKESFTEIMLKSWSKKRSDEIRRKERAGLSQQPKKLAASELAKAPIEYEESAAKYLGDETLASPPKQQFNKYKHVTSYDAGPGRFHHVYHNTFTDEITHQLTDSESPWRAKNVFSDITGKPNEDGSLNIIAASVDPEHKGKGHGKALYAQALAHHGKIYSDELVSRMADKAYSHLEGMGAKVKRGAWDTRERHEAVATPEMKQRIGWKDEEKLAASELQKGVKRRLFSFNPQADLDSDIDQTSDIRTWTTYDRDGYLSTLDEMHEIRDSLPEMNPKAKKRGLISLASKTKTRIHPKTGERQYLLHRGVSAQEARSVIENNHISHKNNSSWSPSAKVAERFVNQKYMGETHLIPNQKLSRGKRVSAWINESDIHSIPHQYGQIDEYGNAGQGEPEYKDEFEVIVKPHRSEKAFLPRQTKAQKLHQRINYTPMPSDEYENKMPPSQAANRAKTRLREKFGLNSNSNVKPPNNSKKLAASELQKVSSPKKGHTIAQLERLKQDNWHNPDTGKEMSAEESERYLWQMRQNKADKKVKESLKAPKASSGEKPEDWFGESELKKMSRPRITFPNLKQVSTRPDQEVQPIETGRQKEILGRKITQAYLQDPKEQAKVSKLTPSQKEKVYADNAKRRISKFSNRTLGFMSPTATGPMSSTLVGKLRSKFEEGDDQDAAKLEAWKQKKRDLSDQYNKAVMEWREQASKLAPNADEMWEHYNKRPERPKMPRRPAKSLKQTKDLPREKIEARGRSVDSTIEHEGLHHILDQVKNKYGPIAQDKVRSKLLEQHDPEAIKHLSSYIRNSLGYKTDSYFNEELLAHARDVLVDPKKRENFKRFIQTSMYGTPGFSDEDFKDLMGKLKQGHQKVYQTAQNIKEEDLLVPGQSVQKSLSKSDILNLRKKRWGYEV